MLFLLTGMFAHGQPPVATSDGWLPLFNGQDFTNFYTFQNNEALNANPQGVFKVENGVIHLLDIANTTATQEFGYFATNNDYRNYRLRFEYMWGTKKYPPRENRLRDSGVLYHKFPAPGQTYDRIWPESIECQVQEGDTGDFFLLGSGNNKPTMNTTLVAAGNNKFKAGGVPRLNSSGSVQAASVEDTLTGWNSVEVFVTENEGVHVVNGTVNNAGTNYRTLGADLVQGQIAFQVEGAEVFYRNIEIKPLATTGGGPSYKVLVFSKTAGFRHRSIPEGIAAIQKLGMDNGFEVDSTDNAADFTDANLAQYAAVVWLSTTGDVLNTAQQAAFERYIQAGGGYAGVHAASDTEYTWPWYGGLVAAYFDRHPPQQTATVVIEDCCHPSSLSLPDRWTRFDEWYDFQNNPRTGVNVIATVDETTYNGGQMGADHPIAWYHDYDGGRAWYTGMGHTEESYSEPLFLAHLLGGIEYAAGKSFLAPEEASVLFDGSGTTEFQKSSDGSAVTWPVVEGELVVAPGSGDIQTVGNYGDFKLHLEYRVPASASTLEQQRGNSGVFLQGRYELQILDSFDAALGGMNDAGAIVMAKDPDTNASLPAETWQTFDIDFTAAKFSGATKTADATVTVYHNGSLIHDNVVLAGPTPSGAAEGPAFGPIRLEDGGSEVRFRNIWIQPTNVPDVPVIALAPNELLFTGTANVPAASPQVVVVSNTGTLPLTVPAGGISVSGVYQITSSPELPLTLAPGEMAEIGITFAPVVAGSTEEVLEIQSDDPATPLASLTLRGLASGGAGETNEPSLQQILGFLEIPVTTGDPDPATPLMELPLALPNDELAASRFVKAGPGPVTVEPVALFSQSGDPAMTLGFYQNPGSNSEILRVAGVDSTSLMPTLSSGSTGFDPGAASFGLYSTWPAFPGRVVATESLLNTWETDPALREKHRVYPLRDGDDNVVPDAYIIGIENAAGGDFQDGVVILRNVSISASTALPPPWIGDTVGSGATGGSSWSEGIFSISNRGVDIWGTADSFDFVHQTLEGNGEIIARVDSLGNTNGFAKAGLMMRTDPAPGARNIFMGVTAANGVTFQERATTDGTTTSTRQAGLAAPVWVRLIRRGDLFLGYYRSLPTDPWTLLHSTTRVLPATLEVGLAVTSHNTGATTAADFQQVGIFAYPTVTLSGVDTTLGEFGGDSGTVNVLRDRSLDTSLSIAFSLDPATAGADILLPPAPVIGAGQPGADMVVSAVADALVEGTEMANLSLAALSDQIPGAEQYQVGSPSAVTLTIEDKPSDEWRFIHLGGPVSWTADSDADGLSNFFEYAFGELPNITGLADLPATTGAAGNIQFTWKRRTPPTDFTYHLQHGNTLSDWNPTDASFTEEIIEDDGIIQTIETTYSPPPGPSVPLFLRLKVRTGETPESQ